MSDGHEREQKAVDDFIEAVRRTRERDALGHESYPMAAALIARLDKAEAENARLTSEVSRLEKQNKTMSHNLRVGFQREEALTKELDDLTRAIIELFSPATAKRLAVLAPQEANDEEDGND